MLTSIESPKAKGGVIIATTISATIRQVDITFDSALGQTIMFILFIRKILQTPDMPA
jgi:hypothetical protein